MPGRVRIASRGGSGDSRAFSPDSGIALDHRHPSRRLRRRHQRRTRPPRPRLPGPPRRPGLALLLRAVGALQLLRHAGAAHPVPGQLPLHARDRGPRHRHRPAAPRHRERDRPALDAAAGLGGVRPVHRLRLPHAHLRRPAGRPAAGPHAHRRHRRAADGAGPLPDGLRDRAAAGPGLPAAGRGLLQRQYRRPGGRPLRPAGQAPRQRLPDLHARGADRRHRSAHRVRHPGREGGLALGLWRRGRGHADRPGGLPGRPALPAARSGTQGCDRRRGAPAAGSPRPDAGGAAGGHPAAADAVHCRQPAVLQRLPAVVAKVHGHGRGRLHGARDLAAVGGRHRELRDHAGLHRVLALVGHAPARARRDHQDRTGLLRRRRCAGPAADPGPVHRGRRRQDQHPLDLRLHAGQRHRLRQHPAGGPGAVLAGCAARPAGRDDRHLLPAPVLWQHLRRLAGRPAGRDAGLAVLGPARDAGGRRGRWAAGSEAAVRAASCTRRARGPGLTVLRGQTRASGHRGAA
mmetsp:Transcript_5578/g.21538  ORF Transcript_5578/g.21538 Transcript_5578/m.21538 type:complete len:517 (+) Transcript_5578:686-2236(+)